MGYTHYWYYKNPVFDMANIVNKKAEISRSSRGDYESVKKEFAKFPTHRELTKRIKKHIEAFNKISDDLNHALIVLQKEKDFVLRGVIGEGEPTISDNEICFNGDGSNGQDLDHETFVFKLFQSGHNRKIDEFEKDGVFGFCKTARKPYDVAVCVSLMVIKHHIGSDFSISSDGDLEDGWGEAIEFYEKFFKRKAPKQLMTYLTKENA